MCWVSLLVAGGVSAGEPANGILIDTGRATLTVFRDGQPLTIFSDIAIGRFGATADKHRGDGMTPRGRYRVVAIEPSRGFHYFIRLDYPSVADAERGRRAGIISERERQAIELAHRERRLPPQDTALGGQIGIHGLGKADPELHALYNWTRGCVALTDLQLDSLLTHITVGMPVEIR